MEETANPTATSTICHARNGATLSQRNAFGKKGSRRRHALSRFLGGASTHRKDRIRVWMGRIFVPRAHGHHDDDYQHANGDDANQAAQAVEAALKRSESRLRSRLLQLHGDAPDLQRHSEHGSGAQHSSLPSLRRTPWARSERLLSAKSTCVSMPVATTKARPLPLVTIVLAKQRLLAKGASWSRASTVLATSSDSPARTPGLTKPNQRQRVSRRERRPNGRIPSGRCCCSWRKTHP